MVVAFTAGAACLIAAAELGNFFGVEIPRGASVPAVLHHFLAHLDHVNPATAGVRAMTLAAIYPKLAPEVCRRCTVRSFRECHASLPNGEPVPRYSCLRGLIPAAAGERPPEVTRTGSPADP